jgi:hypothetical protein
VPEAILKEFLTQDSKKHSDYLGALNAWQGRFPETQLMVGYFDELESDPRGLFVRVLNFLAIDAGPSSIPPSIGENRRASRGSKAPIEYRVFLARLHLDQLRALHERLESEWTRRWLDEALELIGDDEPSLTDPVRGMDSNSLPAKFRN